MDPVSRLRAYPTTPEGMRANTVWKSIIVLGAQANKVREDVVFERYRLDVESNYESCYMPILMVNYVNEDDSEHVIVLGYSSSTCVLHKLLDTNEKADRVALRVSGKKGRGGRMAEDPFVGMPVGIKGNELGAYMNYKRHSRINNDIIYDVLINRVYEHEHKRGPVLSIRVDEHCCIYLGGMKCQLESFARRMYWAWVSIEYCNGRELLTDNTRKKQKQ